MGEKRAIIAAGGHLPLQLARVQNELGFDVTLLALEGSADPATVKAADLCFNVLAVRQITEALKARGVTTCIFIGAMQRPDLAVSVVDAGLEDVLARLKASPGGDDALLRAVIGHFEAEGFTILSAEAAMTDLKAPAGCLTVRTAEDYSRDVVRGIDVLRALAPFDVGQACIIADTQVIAIEGPEGTDAMIARAGSILSAQKRDGGVLIKLPKMGQDRRIDLPAIGPLTVENAIKAGLKGIIFQAEGALLIEQDKCVALADQGQIFLEGKRL